MSIYLWDKFSRGLSGLVINPKVSSLFSPAVLFANNEPGVWYDPSDLSTLFQDTTGTTPVTTAGQTVALMLDKSKGLTLGPELVTNGAFDTDTDGWTPTNATLSISSQRLRITKLSASFSSAGQLISGLGAGKTYQLTLNGYVGSAEVRVLVGSGINSGEIYSPAQSAIDISPTVLVTGKTSFWVTLLAYGATGTYAEFDNISVKELSGLHATQPTTAARPTYGIVPETGRRNLLGYTEEFDNADWVKFESTVSANAIVAPNGSLSADKLVENTTSQRHLVQLSVSAPGQNTLSVFVKDAGDSRFVELRPGGVGAGVFYAKFDPSDGSLTDSGGTDLVATSTEPVGDGWHRVSVTYDTAVAVTSVQVACSNASTGEHVIYTGNGTSGIYIWGAQLEEGSTATAYQKVTTALDVTEAGVTSLGYLSFDGLDDWMVTPTITPGIDKVQVFAGVRKLSDAATGFLVETSSSSATFDGSFLMAAPSGIVGSTEAYHFGSRGTDLRRAAAPNGQFAAPITNVLVGLGDISGDLVTLRIDGTQVAEDTDDLGTGNFLAYPMYIGSRNGLALRFNGHLHQLITRFGANLEVAQIESTEAYVAGKTGVTL